VHLPVLANDPYHCRTTDDLRAILSIATAWLLVSVMVLAKHPDDRRARTADHLRPLITDTEPPPALAT
jgi:hypothetical protein